MLSREFDVPLLSRKDVRERLSKADWVSVKLDAVDPDIWQLVNRPDLNLDHEAMLEGILRFATRFQGTLATETMLVAGVNDGDGNAEAAGGFIKRIAHTVPTSPPRYVRWRNGLRSLPSWPASTGSSRSCGGTSTTWSS